MGETAAQTPPPPPSSHLPPNVKNDYDQWWNANEQMGMDYSAILALCAQLKHVHGAFSDGLELCMTVMEQVQNYQGDQVAGQAAVQNIDSDLRNAMNTAQSDANSISYSSSNLN